MQFLSVLAVILFLSPFSFATNKSEADLYRDHIQPIFTQRCVACHSCFNAPCQLNLQDYSGFERGVNKLNVYDGTRTSSVEPTRVGIDAQNVKEWRQRGFFDIHTSSTIDDNIFWRIVNLRVQNPHLPIKRQVADSKICPTTVIDSKSMATAAPEMGMPYGFPALNKVEAATLKTWLEKGAPGPTTLIPVSETAQKQMREWEAFLNENTLKQKLVSRYLYEHLFLAHIHFPENAREYFRLVRSKKACAKGVDEIATRRPNADPGQENFFYCLKSYTAAIAYKTHLPFAFSPQKLARFKKIFFSEPWTVKEFPTYKNEVAENPFVAFIDIPSKARYQFLLDDAQYQVATFIKGPVCNGSQAVNSIQEQFYVLFLQPDSDLSVTSRQYEQIVAQMLVLPGKWGSDISLSETPSLIKEIADYREKYRFYRAETLTKARPEGYAMKDIWNGDETNPNALLTVFRHDDNAVVMKGAMGDTPKTLFVLDYPLLERLVYNLVVNFDVFGNISHQMLTRIYMDMIRMEAEELFLMFLPPDQRVQYRKEWYEGLLAEAKMKYLFPPVGASEPTAVPYAKTKRTKSQFISKVLFEHLNEKVRGPLDALNWKTIDLPAKQRAHLKPNTQEQSLRQMTSVHAEMKTPFARFFPDVAYLLVDGKSPKAYTIIHNKEHENISWILGESLRMKPSEDTLTLREGFWGSYINMIFRVPEKDLAAFSKKVAGLKTEKDYQKLVAQYGVTRNQERFWRAYDDLHHIFSQSNTSEFGYLDLTRYSLE